jgi:hypothetical protein
MDHDSRRKSRRFGEIAAHAKPRYDVNSMTKDVELTTRSAGKHDVLVAGEPACPPEKKNVTLIISQLTILAGACLAGVELAKEYPPDADLRL